MYAIKSNKLLLLITMKQKKPLLEQSYNLRKNSLPFKIFKVDIR